MFVRFQTNHAVVQRAAEQMNVLFKGASKCKETREEQLFLVWDKGWNALPYLVRLKQDP